MNVSVSLGTVDTKNYIHLKVKIRVPLRDVGCHFGTSSDFATDEPFSFHAQYNNKCCCFDS